MPRVAKVWWRESHGAYYAKINGKQLRLSADYKEANQLFHKLRAQPAKQVSTDSVFGVLDEYLEWCKTNKPKSYTWYQAMLKWFTNHFRPMMPNMRIDQLKPYDVQKWLDSTSYESSTKAGIVAALKRAFNWAVKEVELLSSNPLAALKKPEASRREEFLTQKDFNDLLKLVPDTEFKELLTVFWLTGARPHEIMRMEAKNVYGDHVLYQKENAKGKKKQRLIFLPPEARAIVKRLTAEHPDGPIFRNTDGNPWTNYATNNRFEDLKAEKKLGKKLCMYQLRHGFAHRALTGAQLSPEVTAQLMGHSDTSMIYKVYGHLGANHEFMQAAATKAAKGAGVESSEADTKKPKKKPR